MQLGVMPRDKDEEYDFMPKITPVNVWTYPKSTSRGISIKNTLFTFDYSFRINSHNYEWRINKTFYEFKQLQDCLFVESMLTGIPKPNKLPKKRKFKKRSAESMLEILDQNLQWILNTHSVRNSRPFREFSEVSSVSFKDTRIKRKEGWVFKVGSGRFSNQKRLWNCFNLIPGSKKLWLVVLDDALQYMPDPYGSKLAEVILFRRHFKIRHGLDKSGFHDGIRIKGEQHNLLFRAGNILRKDEWVEAINDSLAASEYMTANIRFSSSFLVRNNNHAEWFIDGEGYFDEVCTCLHRAQREVYITDWWLSPELYLKRPSDDFPNSQLVEILGHIADRGVQVYVIIYKEISYALASDSLHAKRTLQARNPNIRVARHPNISYKGGQFLWSHHQKIVLIDNTVGFIGGLDLCYGRWDTNDHELVDNGPVQIWKGIDYSNVRVSDYTEVENWNRDLVDRNKIPRMPWHDIAVKAVGKVANDIGIHFMEVWNHILHDITGETGAINLHIKPPIREKARPIKEKFLNALLRRKPAIPEEVPEKKRENVFLKKGMMAKLVESALPREQFIDLKQMLSDFSKRETEDINEPIHYSKANLNTEEREFVKKHADQPTIGILGDDKAGNKAIFQQMVKNFIKNKFPNPQSDEESKHPGHSVSDLNKRRKDEENEEARDRKQLITHYGQNKENWFTNFIKPRLEDPGRVGSCECQFLRSSSLWSCGLTKTENSIHEAYLSLIARSKHFIFIENQFFISSTAGHPVRNQVAKALVERIKAAARAHQPFRVIVVIPLLPGFEGNVDDPAASVLRVQLHWIYRTIIRSDTSIYNQLKADPNVGDPWKYISFHSYRNHSFLRSRPVTELIYIHSKLMIVDDDIVLVGSANINDRSLLGNRDAEVALCLIDNNKVRSTLADQSIEVSYLAHTLRMSIYKEALGIKDENLLRDPVSYRCDDLWRHISKRNTELYRHIFRCYPDDEISRISDIKDFMNMHRLEEYESMHTDISGHLVDFPLLFLNEENLNLKIFNKEYILPVETFI